MPNELSVLLSYLSFRAILVLSPSTFTQVFQVGYFLEFSRRGAYVFLLHACYTTTEHITTMSCKKKFLRYTNDGGAYFFLLHACYTTTEHITTINCKKKVLEVHKRRTAIPRKTVGISANNIAHNSSKLT
jgi:hypothetical protein